MLLTVIPFRWIPRLFANPQSAVRPGPATSGVRIPEKAPLFRDSQQSEVITLISTATAKTARVCPWKNKCLVSSLAARCMLRRRKIHSGLSLGVAKAGGGKVIAHAWLIAGDAEIVPKGGDFHQLYLF
ncbi:MAG: lasso peptide biosynthesis B2 protein [Bacteroidales bacterium]|nr:lasso peptide biosynthesis B2 protein [Bacteroidales bacterium]